MRSLVATGLVVAALVLAGCSDDPEPRFSEPTETPSASDPTTSAAAEPEPWEQRSKAGARAFVAHWIDTFNASVNSGETQMLDALSAPRCESCAGIIERTDSIASRGGMYRTDGWRVRQQIPTPGQPLTEPIFTLRIERSAERFRESSGAPIQTNPASAASYRAELVWRFGKWQMSELVLFA